MTVANQMKLPFRASRVKKVFNELLRLSASFVCRYRYIMTSYGVCCARLLCDVLIVSARTRHTRVRVPLRSRSFTHLNDAKRRINFNSDRKVNTSEPRAVDVLSLACQRPLSLQRSLRLEDHYTRDVHVHYHARWNLSNKQMSKPFLVTVEDKQSFLARS